jgi:hypothetical protein
MAMGNEPARLYKAGTEATIPTLVVYISAHLQEYLERPDIVEQLKSW